MLKTQFMVLTAALAVSGAAYAVGDTATHAQNNAPQARASADARTGADMARSGGIRAGSDASPVNAQVPAVAGGVGLNARADLRSDAPDHNVKMVFSLDTGNYLADVHVKVSDGSGRTVIDGISDGPWMYAKLQPGNYTVTADYGGHQVTQRLSVGRSGDRVAHLRWPASVEQQVVASRSASADQILGTGPQEPQR